MICTDLRCERLVEPIGIGTATQRLTWRLEENAGETDVVQQSCEVELDGGWSSGHVEGWRQQLTYNGPKLDSRTAVRWRVRASTSPGETGWSDWATFETGILDPSEWTAKMITATASTPVVRFASTFEVPNGVVRARLRMTAQGIVTTTIDGVDVGEDVLVPGWTAYQACLPVRTYDVAPLLFAGDVEVAATVAPGWFSGRIGFGGGSAIYGTHVGVLVQLEMERADGSLVVVGSDGSWTATSTPWTLAGIYEGETYDARTPITQAAVSVVDGFDHAVLCAPSVPPVRGRLPSSATTSWRRRPPIGRRPSARPGGRTTPRLPQPPRPAPR